MRFKVLAAAACTVALAVSLHAFREKSPGEKLNS